MSPIVAERRARVLAFEHAGARAFSPTGNPADGRVSGRGDPGAVRRTRLRFAPASEKGGAISGRCGLIKGCLRFFPDTWVRSCPRSFVRREMIDRPRGYQVGLSRQNRPARSASRRINARRPPSGRARSINRGCHTDYEPGERPPIKIAPDHRLRALRRRQMAELLLRPLPGILFAADTLALALTEERVMYFPSSRWKPMLPSCIPSFKRGRRFV